MTSAAIDLANARPRALPTAAAAIALAASLAVIVLFAIYPLGVSGDYPNHLARTWIEANIATSAALARYYDVAFGAIPDLTMDLVIPPLSKLIGIYPAGAVVLTFAALLTPLAAFALSRRHQGSAGGAFAALGFLTIFNVNLEFGFINFMVATGLALFAFGAWASSAPGWRRVLIFAPASLFLAVNHAFGLLLFGYLVLLWETGAHLRRERGTAPQFLNGLFLRDSFAFLPGLALLGLSFISGGDGALRPVDAPTDYWASRLVVLTSPFRFYSDGGAVAAGVASIIAVYGGVGLLLTRRIVEIDPRMKLVLAGVLALVLVLPEHMLGIWGLHFRFPAAFIALLGASLRFRADAPRANALISLGVAGVLAIQFLNGAEKIRAADAYLGEMRAAFAALPEGARVLQSFDLGSPVRLGTDPSALAVIEKDAYVAGLFTNTSPVAVKPEMRAMHLPGGYRITSTTLAYAARQPLPPAANGQWSESYYFDWPRRFTHVLHVKAEGASAPSLPEACLISDGRFHALYASGECLRGTAPTDGS